MGESARNKSAGGAATSGGTTFQEDVACYFATLILAETAAHLPAGLPQSVTLASLVTETPFPIDDLLVETSVGGVLCVQVKTSLSLSEDAESALATVIGQFVRQYLAGVRLVGDTPRLPDPVRDRFILAVGYGAPTTIATSLASVLTKCRTVTDGRRLSELPSSLNAEDSKALAITRVHIQRCWIAIKGLAPTVVEELAVIHLMYVLQLDMRTDGVHIARAKDLLRQTVLADAGRADDAWDALLAICRAFGPQRMGGDLSYLRTTLQNRGIPLRSVLSFTDDIQALKKYTADRLAFLQRLSVLQLEGHRIKINREVLGALQDFGLAGHTAVVGEPGAGKSGCVHDLAEHLLASGADVVLVAADLIDASSPEALARDLSLSRNRSLVDVLQNWSGEGSAFLLVDALDAARSGMSLHVLCQLLRDVRERAPRWRIVASIREYDLRTSPDVQDLFVGQPHPDFKDERFPTVRHVRVGRLSPSEISQVTRAHSRVAAAMQATPGLTELVRNPFNLNLLCKLLDNNVTDADLRAVETQVGLLDLYWSRRVESGDRAARVVVLTTAIDRMVGVRALHIQTRVLARDMPTHTAALTSLFSDGVLIELAAKPTAAPIIGFSHNILFDYAACRLWLDGLNDTVVARLSEAANADLLLAIRPSIVMAFQQLWAGDSSRADFWERAAAFERSPGMRLIGKIIAAGVAAEHYVRVDDTSPLLTSLRQRSGFAVALLRFTIQAAISQQDTDPRRRLFGEGAPAWLDLAAELSHHLDQVAWEVRSLLWPVSRATSQTTPEQALAANVAAIALLRFGLATPRYHNVVRVAIEVAAGTIASDPDGTVAALGEVLRSENLSIGAHEWLHPLAERLHVIARTRPEFALQVTDVVFAASGDRDAAVPMGGRILPMSMNKHDLVRMARHDVEDHFVEIWNNDPVNATRIVLRVMHATLETEHPRLTEPKNKYQFDFRGKRATLTPDASYIWTAGDHNRHEEWYKILVTFQQGLKDLATRGDDGRMLGSVLAVLRDEADLAVIWSSVLEAASEEPQTLGREICELIASTEVLSTIDTRKAAGDLIHSVFEHLSEAQQAAVETAILRIPQATPDELAEFALQGRNRMVGCVPVELIRSPELRRIRAELDSAGGPPPNERDFSISTSSGRVDGDWWLRQKGVQLEKPENATLIRLSKALKNIPGGKPSEKVTAAEASLHLPILLETDAALQTAAAADPPLVQQVGDELVDACERLTHVDGLWRDMPLTDFVRATLRRGASADRPRHSDQDDEQWDRDNAGWGSPLPRVDAASGLMRLAVNPNTVDDDILADLERLAQDSVPAVRYQVLAQCGWLYHTAPERMWAFVASTCTSEPRTAILTHFCANVVLRLPKQDDRRLEPLVRQLYRRARRNTTIGAVRRYCATYYLRLALWRGDARGSAYVAVFANNPHGFPTESNTIVDHCRELIGYDGADTPQENSRVRAWAFQYLTHVVTAVREHAALLRARHASASLDQWPAEDVESLRRCHAVAHNVATELYIGSGASDGRRRGAHASNGTAPSDTDKRQLVQEATALLDALCDIEFVESAYDVLQTLEYLIGVDRLGVIERVARLVRNAERDGIHYESMAADLVVRVVERYLAEHGTLFRENLQARAALLDILDIFVGAGWPSATRLTYRLGEVFR